MNPATPAAYKLLHDGSLALARVEANGFAVDWDYLETASSDIQEQIEAHEAGLQRDPLWKSWKKIHGEKAKITARNQLMTVLVAEKIVTDVKLTDKGNIRGDRDALEQVDHPFVTEYLAVEKLRKLHGTYLKGLMREVSDDGKVHCFFNLHLVTSYRGSCDSPNLQNIPIRDEQVAKIIRRAFVPCRRNRQIVEIDFSGVEVRIAACYNKDPRLISYIDGQGDMHRDAAADLFLCKKSQVSKMMRSMTKNQYVFPQFYGSYYKQCAPHLWESIDRYKFEVDGVPMKEHLKSKGIISLGDCQADQSARPGTFEKHVAKAEDVLWNQRFKVYSQWKRSWYEQYLRRGYLRYKTGFVVDCVLNRKEACNWPIQGSSFHCLLWSLIQIERLTRKKKIDALIVSQVHDSIIADVHKDHVDDYIELALKVMTKLLPKHWSWINVKLLADAEVSPVGGSWFDKESYKL